MGSSIRDPGFWRRFSIAVHADEEAKTPSPEKEHTFFSDDWLKSQRRKKRRTRLFGSLLAFFIVGFAVGVAIVIWWLARNNWMRNTPGKDKQS